MNSKLIKALSDNERLLLQTQQIAGLGTYVMDIGTGHFTSSSVLNEIFGLPKDYPHTFEGWLGVVHPDDRQMMADYFHKEVLGLRRKFNKEYRIIRVVDGVERWVHGYGDLDLDADNIPVVMIGAVQDITERKCSEKALQQSETRYRELIDLAVDGILVGSQDGVIIDANRYMCELTGLSRDELVGKHIGSVFVTPENLASTPWRFDLLQKGETVISEQQILHKDGALAHIEMRTKLMPEGTFQSIWRDVTERKNAETSLLNFTKLLSQRVDERTREFEGANIALKQNVAQLRKLAMELTQAEELERKRLASILHDQVQQFIVAATMKISSLDVQSPAAEHARCVQDILATLREALNASRSLTLSLCPPVLLEAGLMPGLRWLADWMTDKHGLSVKVTGDDLHVVPGPLCILLFQAVRELLFNVVKHAGVQKASVSVNHPDAKSLRLLIVDCGKGFTQKESGARNLSSGFGLFTLRERITYIGGVIEVVSEPGHGTRITITVPL
ncbi:MAG: PAS domain S-box protein [bacterium]